jgi:hypothetical protein
MDTIILEFIIVISFIVGWIKSSERLKTLPPSINNRSLLSYLLK